MERSLRDVGGGCGMGVRSAVNKQTSSQRPRRVIIYLLLVFELHLGRVVIIVNLISTAIYYVNTLCRCREFKSFPKHALRGTAATSLPVRFVVVVELTL